MASTAEARLSSWPFSLSPGGTADRRGGQGPWAWAATQRAGTPLGQALNLRISSAMALWVRFSSFSSFLATSLLRSLWEGGGRRPEVEGWPDAAKGPALPAAPWALGTTLSCLKEWAALGGRPGCSSLFVLQPPNPVPVRLGLALQTPLHTGDQVRVREHGRFLRGPLGPWQGVACSVYCGSCSPSNHWSLAHQELPDMHTRPSLSAPGFLGHGPRASASSN